VRHAGKGFSAIVESECALGDAMDGFLAVLDGMNLADLIRPKC
jgi:hypothetical protein